MKYTNYIPHALLTSYMVKCLLSGDISLYQSIVVASLCSLVGLYEYLQRNKRMAEMEDAIAKQNETILAMAKKIGAIETSMTGVKMAQNIKSMSF